jgi:addiction module RelE/StbE family toxin
MARKHRLLWTGPALDDLREIRDYVSRDNPSAAKKLASSIRKAVLRLQRHPRSGRAVPELPASGYREVIVTPYRIVYAIANGVVVVLRVWHGRRAI